MEIHTSEYPEREAGEALRASLSVHRETPTLLLVSGGSAFDMLTYVDDEVFGENLTIGVLDERYSTDSSVNNFAQLANTSFFVRAHAQGVSVIDTRIEAGEGMYQLQDRWEQTLRTWREAHPYGVVIATMGVGADGHTAGIFPGIHNASFDDDSWVVAYSVDPSVNQYTERVTATYTFLRNVVDEVFVYIRGENKRQAFHKIQAPLGDIQSVPARILRELSNVKIFTDMWIE